MKKSIFAAVVVCAALLCSCSGDSCKCTTKTYDGNGKKTAEVDDVPTVKPDGKTCNDVAKSLSKDLGDLGKTVVTCKTVQKD
ncbi:MAG: hypothetical protein MJY67_06155 [Bacteroidales bacterium]|nr:hypothetical protein [Bacteroidales bacterium]